MTMHKKSMLLFLLLSSSIAVLPSNDKEPRKSQTKFERMTSIPIEDNANNQNGGIQQQQQQEKVDGFQTPSTHNSDSIAKSRNREALSVCCICPWSEELDRRYPNDPNDPIPAHACPCIWPLCENISKYCCGNNNDEDYQQYREGK